MSNPVAVQIDYTQKRSRLSNFFRFILAIPLVIMLYVYLIVGFIAVIIAWFALLFTGRWPTGLYNFTAGVVAWLGRVTAYLHYATDAYPPFGLTAPPEYPVHITIDPPLPKYSRLKVFFRGIYQIPVVIVSYLLAIMVSIVALVSWLVIIVTGRQPQGLQNILVFGIAYYTRATALMLLVSESYPPLSDATTA